MNRSPVTPEGFIELQRKLEHEKGEVRMGIVKDIEEARAHGDISENSEFEDAKERQALCDGRIRALESALATAEVVDITKIPVTERIVFGCWVGIENVESGEVRKYRIVGEEQADVEQGLISYKSPIANALIGRSLGDEVDVVTPQGKVAWEVIEVHYGVEAP